MSISVICLTYKRINLLEEAIYSVLNQSHQDWELIIVNDCPEQDLVFEHPKVRIFNLKEKFKTVGAKRNFAWQKCTKDYVVTLDDDDLFLPNYLETLLNAIGTHDVLSQQKVWFYKNDTDIKISERSMTSIFLCRRVPYQEEAAYPEINFDEVAEFHGRILMVGGNVLFKALQAHEVGYVYRRGIDPNYSVYNMNVMDLNVQDSTFKQIPVQQTGQIQLNPHWDKDYVALIKAKGVNTIKKLSPAELLNSLPPLPTPEPLPKPSTQQKAIGGWEKVKSTWEKASSFVQAVQSRGLISTAANVVGITDSLGERAPEEVYLRRKLSCFGDGKIVPECEVLKRSPKGLAYCGACGCGANKLAMLEGNDYNKLYYPYLECPLKKPGFSNEEIPISIIIPVLNDNEELNLTIKSIYETSPASVEIIAIDDASDVPASVDDPRVKLFRFDTRKGAGQARHFGAQHAKAKHLLFIDSHMRFDPRWFKNAMERITTTPKTLWCGACLGLNAENMDINKAKGVYLGANLVLYAEKNHTIFDGVWKPEVKDQDDYEIGCVMGACYFIHKDWYFHIKGLEQTMMWGSEEPILSVKTWLAGGEVRVMKSVRLGHKFRDVAPYATQVSHINYNKLAYMYMLFPPDLFEKIKSKFNQNKDLKLAMDMVEKNKQALDAEREYYKSIFHRDIYWLCDKFQIQLPDIQVQAAPVSSSLYDDTFFKKRVSYKKRAPVMMKGLIDLYHPSSYLDCGAALGDLVQEALNQKIDAYGVEGNDFCLPYLQCPPEKMMIRDLTQPLSLGRKYDVLTALEVAEHIEEQFVDAFVSNICQLSDRLVISICDYGPTTKVHPTVKPHSWWMPKFESHGFHRCPDKEAILKQNWDTIKTWPAVKEAYRNLIILER